MNYRIIKAICKEIASANIAANISNFAIRIDEPTPCGVIIPALEIIQLSLLDTGLAVRAKSREIQMGKTGTKAVDFYRPGRGVTSPGEWCQDIERLSSFTMLKINPRIGKDAENTMRPASCAAF